MEPIKQDKKEKALWSIVVIVIVLTPLVRQCPGKNISSMYKVEVLSRLKERYPENISWNYEHVIMSVLTEKERAALQGVRLVYPLVGEGGDPFRYSTRVEGKDLIIVVPIFSVKFLDDLAIAAAWLDYHGFTTETLQEYVAMLKYQGAEKFEDSRYPTPLEALHIPAKLSDNIKVDEVAQDLLKTTAVYILSRELGSLHFSGAYTLKKASWEPQQIQMKQWQRPSRQQELILQCDAFALEIMRRIGIPPHKLTFYLSAQVYWAPNRIDFRDDKTYLEYQDNPRQYTMFPDRLHQIAELMAWGKEDYARQKIDKLANTSQIERAAREIFKLSYIFENQSVQRQIRQKALAQKIEDLKPRRK